MLQLSFIREKTEETLQRLSKRNINSTETINKILALDGQRKKNQTTLDNNNQEANTIAKKIGELFKAGNTTEANEFKNRTVVLKEENKKLQEELSQREKDIQQLLYTLPNLPHESVPHGKSPADNKIVYEEGNKPALYADAVPHWDLAAKYQLIDFELGNKITGAGFPVYKGKGARLQRALINFFLEEAVAAGYLEVQPPLMVNEASGYGTGQLPDKEGQMYFVGLDNFYLIPTAEVPITNLYRDVILKEADFPVKNAGYTPCFRREAGSYGKDVRGLNRLHQFDKVEIVQVQHPEKSYETLEQMLSYVKTLLQKLELPFRVALLCGGDMGFASAKTYDMEVFCAAQQKWLEVSSISNFETFQSNRMKLRFKDKNGKMQLAHTLNGSALALPRIVASLLENNQTAEGIKIPKALVKYTGFEVID